MSLENNDLKLRPFRIKLIKYIFYAQHANVLVLQPVFDKVPLYSCPITQNSQKSSCFCFPSGGV